MIRPLRRRHLRVVVGLAMLVPAVYLTAIQARRPAALSEPLAPELAPTRSSGDARAVSTEEWPELPIDLRLLAAGADRWIEIVAREELPHPDVLVYWSATEPTSGSLLTEAKLLGALAGDETRSYLLPQEAGESAGHLILYCLGHGELLGSRPVPAGGAAGIE